MTALPLQFCSPFCIFEILLCIPCPAEDQLARKSIHGDFLHDLFQLHATNTLQYLGGGAVQVLIYGDH